MEQKFPSGELIDRTIQFWKIKFDRDLSNEEASVILRKLAEFGALLYTAHLNRPSQDQSKKDEVKNEKL